MKKTRFSMLAILAASMIITGCGSDNKVGAGNNTNGSFDPFGYGNGSGGSNTSSAINQIKSQEVCSYGARLPDMSFVYTGSGMNQGYQNSTGAWYAGKNYGTNDLIFIQEISSGNQVTGYNVVLSFCSDINQGTGQYIIGGNAQLSNFQLGQVQLDFSAQCSLKKVGFARVQMSSSNYPGPIVTDFAPIQQCL